MMKKLIFLLTASVAISGVFAQNNNVQSAYAYNNNFQKHGKCKDLKDGLELINKAAEHEKTKGWAKTWKYRGDIYFNILNSKDGQCKSLDTNAIEECTDSYMKALVYNFKDPELKKIDLNTQAGMMKFMGTLQSKPKVDDEAYPMDILMRRFPSLAIQYGNKGINQFSAKEYKGAQESFGKSMMMSSFGGKIDTIIMYNTALASEYAGDNESAKQMYDALIGLKYNTDNNGPNLYAAMANIYKKEGNAEKSIEYIKNGRIAYPTNNNLLVSELSYYLENGKHEEALTNLNQAIVNDPENPLFYYARGSVYDNLKQSDKAIVDYEKAIELKPTYYDPNYNLGAYYFNTAADKINEANKLPFEATKKYNALKAAAKADFEKAIPYIEAANVAKPEDVDTANMLIKLYTQTSQFEKKKALEAKYK